MSGRRRPPVLAFAAGVAVALAAVAGAVWQRSQAQPDVVASRDDAMALPAAVPADPPQRPTATAAVDESDIYGLRLLGVPVRSAPATRAALVAMVGHGDVLTATCWVDGEQLSTGFPEQPLADAYTSALWFRVRVGDTEGFIPDTRFSRSAATGRLNLEPCPI
ncbi:MAG: hypothetical protein IT196_03530 [Acidimicrobiales bacterium]|nr:hypothetical protein [Acidimicrobiales bacterium]